MDINAGVWFVGVDGGGTRCRVRVRDAVGRVRAEVEGGSANVYLAFESAIQNIQDAVAEALVQAGAGSAEAKNVGLGLAGISGPEMAGRVTTVLAGLGRVTATHDGDVACLGAHGGRDGGLIIAGTGSAAVARIGGDSVSVGGRGFIMGDDGSGGRLGLEALRRALRAHDGLEPRSGLTETLMQAFDDDPVRLIAWGRTARSTDFGQYVPLVFSSARNGDPVGLDLVTRAATAIDELGAALRRLGVSRLCLVGGLASALRPYLPASLVAVLHEPLFDAQDGAMLLAGLPAATLATHA